VFVVGYGIVLLVRWVRDRAGAKGLETSPTAPGAPRPAEAGSVH
jgi:hypothetical protein